jgi:ACR3 family arsenite transporter
MLIFVFYIPTLMLLLQVTSIHIPWDTAFISVALFMAIPGALAGLTRMFALRYRNQAWLDRLVALFQPGF